MVPENDALMTIGTFVRLRTNEITSYLIVFFMISFFDCTNWLAPKPTRPASQSLSLRRLFFFFTIIATTFIKYFTFEAKDFRKIAHALRAIFKLGNVSTTAALLLTHARTKQKWRTVTMKRD